MIVKTFGRCKPVDCAGRHGSILFTNALSPILQSLAYSLLCKILLLSFIFILQQMTCLESYLVFEKFTWLLNWFILSLLFGNYPFPKQALALLFCRTHLLKTLLDREKLLVTSNSPIPIVFSAHLDIAKIFCHFHQFKIVVCKLFQFERV